MPHIVDCASACFNRPTSHLRTSSCCVGLTALEKLDGSVPFFTTHHVPESRVDTAAEAIRQAGIMMERVKAVHENSEAAYDASAALRANVQVSWLPTELVLFGYAT